MSQTSISRVLVEADRLLGEGRGAEAASLAGQTLGSVLADRDLEARLHLIRVVGFAEIGRSVETARSLARALASAREDLTRARLEECRGVLAWRRLGLSDAARHLEDAEALFKRGGLLVGAARTLGHLAGVRADQGALKEARRVAARRLELVCRWDDENAISRAKSDLAALLITLGRWRDAERELGGICARSMTWLEVRRSGLDLALGNVGAALDRLGNATANGLPSLLRAEALLVISDAALAAGDAVRAEVAAGEAIAIRVRLADVGGECRARVRRAHALLGLGRTADAVAEARRASRLVPNEAQGLIALSAATLGRTLLRRNPNEAASAFHMAIGASGGRVDVASASGVGVAVARGGPGWQDEVERRLDGLKQWGDARLLALVAQDLRRTPPPRRLVISASGSTPTDACILGAVQAFRMPTSVESRWACALRSIRPVLPWSRVWIVGPGRVLEAMPEGAELREAEEDSPGALIVRQNPSSRLVTLPGPQTDGGGERHVIVEVGPHVHLCVGAATAIADGDLLDVALAFGALAARLAPETVGLFTAPSAVAQCGRGRLVGRSRGIRALQDEIGRVAGTDLTVHVFGETGTGKERVARALHDLSKRASRPFVAVNVACLSDELFQSEVFGHVRGAFTNAVTDREGLVSRAEGGTLFLDEIADLSAAAQVKLLRFLQEREYERLGEGKLRKANVRIVTASNVELTLRVAQARFRPDLFYRLDYWQLRIPPLREREGDVRLLAEHFLRDPSGGEQRGSLSAQALARLEAYPWPGNVRELEATVEKLIVVGGGGAIAVEHVDRVLPSTGRCGALAAPGLRASLRAFERDFVRSTLERNRGHRTRTAESLGISRQALSVKMRQLGL